MKVFKNQFSQYIGIVLGAIYGLCMRWFVDADVFNEFYSIYSICFLWITPIIIGLFPILLASNEIYTSRRKLFFYPILTIILFLIMALVSGFEDFVCLLIIGIPYLVVAGLLGLLLGVLVKNNKKHKSLYSLVLIPFLVNPIEEMIPNISTTYSVSSEIMMEKSKEEIFPNLLSVPTLSDVEYKDGFYQFIGIPRPVFSVISMEDNQMHRIAHFTDELKLYEYVSELKENEFVNFKIDLSKSQLRATPTDQHLLKNNSCRFENINYTLLPISAEQTKVILNCDYRVDAKMNFYANFWAKSIIGDFEDRLLKAIKIKLEQE